MPYKDPEAAKKRAQRYYQEHREETCARVRAYHEENKEERNSCSRLYRLAHKQRLALASRKYRQNNKEKTAARDRKRKEAIREGLKQSFGYTGFCEVCAVSDAVICYDHCHSRGVFRGWLCRECNVALGLMKDSPERLRKLARYVEQAEARFEEEDNYW